MKTNYQTITLEKGEIALYDFGGMKLHAYKTNDPIGNEVFIVEKNKKALIIEPACFFDNIKELENYIASQDLELTGVIASYHMAGASFRPEVPVYSTEAANEYGHTGGGKGLITNFAKIFGESFDSSIFTVTNFLKEGKNTISGIEFVIIPTHDGFDIEIPEIKAVYTHMLGHDCHSIVAGPENTDAQINTLHSFLDKGYDLVLSSHYSPEDLKDVETKIAYLEDVKNIAQNSASKDEFETKVKERYPNYSGENYLDMTSGIFFQN